MKGYISLNDKRCYYLSSLLKKKYDITHVLDDSCDFAFLLPSLEKECLLLKSQHVKIYTLRPLKNYKNYYNLNNDLSFRQMNNLFTVESFLVELINHNDESLYNKRILILGNGDLAKKLACILDQLGCLITISLRNKEKATTNNHYQYIDLKEFHYDYDYMINTIPHEYLNYHEIKKYPSLIVYDLAYDHPIRSEQYIRLKNLPNWYTSYSGALEIQKAIERNIKYGQ